MVCWRFINRWVVGVGVSTALLAGSLPLGLAYQLATSSQSNAAKPAAISAAQQSKLLQLSAQGDSQYDDLALLPVSQRLGKSAELIKLVRQAQLISPTHPVTIYLEALYQLSLGRNPEAEQRLLHCLSVAPNFTRAYEVLVEYYLSQQQLQAAQQLLLPLMDVAGATPQVHYLMGMLLYEKGQHLDAIRHFEVLMDTPIGWVVARQGRWQPKLADAYRRTDQLEKAAGLYGVLTQNSASPYQPEPVTSGLWQEYAEVLTRQQNTGQAQLAYQQAVKLDPTLKDQYWGEAEEQFWNGRQAAALEKGLKLYQLVPDNTLMNWLLASGVSLRRKGQAVPVSLTMLLSNNANGLSVVQQGQAEVILRGQLASATEQKLKNTVGTLPLQQQAIVYLLIQAPEEAFKALRALPASSLNDEQYLQTLLSLGGGQPLIAKLPASSPYAGPAQRFIAPSITLVSQYLGSAFGQLNGGNAQAALDGFSQALDADLFNANAYLGIAMANANLKRTEMVKKAWDLYILLGPNAGQPLDPGLIKQLAPAQQKVLRKLIKQYEPNALKKKP